MANAEPLAALLENTISPPHWRTFRYALATVDAVLRDSLEKRNDSKAIDGSAVPSPAASTSSRAYRPGLSVAEPTSSTMLLAPHITPSHETLFVFSMANITIAVIASSSCSGSASAHAEPSGQANSPSGPAPWMLLPTIPRSFRSMDPISLLKSTLDGALANGR